MLLLFERGFAENVASNSVHRRSFSCCSLSFRTSIFGNGSLTFRTFITLFFLSMPSSVQKGLLQRSPSANLTQQQRWNSSSFFTFSFLHSLEISEDLTTTSSLFSEHEQMVSCEKRFFPTSLRVINQRNVDPFFVAVGLVGRAFVVWAWALLFFLLLLSRYYSSKRPLDRALLLRVSWSAFLSGGSTRTSSTCAR